jgi:hypothetical protein
MNGRYKVLAAIAGMVMLHSIGVLSIHSSALAAGLPKKPIYTNKSRFLIPFKSDATALHRMNTVEIQLYVSRDSGASWDLAQTVTPDGGKFEYQSPGEGEYWFAVKTLDGHNQLHPPQGKYETGLIVVVDATKPVLDLSLRQTSSGKVQLTWRATDPSIDAASLKIDIQAPAAPSWEQVAVGSQTNGEYWLNVSQAGIVSVRGQVADHAGNSTQASNQIRVEAVSNQGVKQRQPLSGPVADLPAAETAQNAETSPSAKLPTPTVADREYKGPIITPHNGLPKYPQSNSQTSLPPKGQFVSNVRSTATPERWNGAVIDASKATAVPVDSTPIQQLPPQTALAPTQFVPATNQTTEDPPRKSPQSTLQRMVPNRRFQIGYEIENVGPSGVGGVELFITEDNGRKWFKYGDDPDQKSPFDVELPHDGVYGFSIRGRSGVGLSTALPVPGERPEIVVAVDQTPPSVEMLPIEQGRGPNANQLRIRWKIQDDFPAEKPASLQYAASENGQVNGPWVDICPWREEMNGSFVWTVGPGIPPQISIRVTARDAVGNVSSAETQSPIVIDLQRPMARIIEIGVDPPTGPR